MNKEVDYYISPNDNENFNKIFNKHEFTLTKKKSKYMYQEPFQSVIKNYISLFTPYDSILLFNGLGTGKTCTAISIAEGFKEYVTKLNKKIIVLVKNKNIEKNFINELIDNKDTGCTMGAYYIKDEDGNEDITQQKLRRIINKTYDIMTYGTFVSRVRGTKVNNDILQLKNSEISFKRRSDHIDDLNNTVIIVDEVHNITNNDAYIALYDILSKSINYRLVLLSATPIYDNPKEIIEISNLLNIKEKEKQLPIRQHLINNTETNQIMESKLYKDLKLKTTIIKLTDYGKEKLINAMKGKVSYLSVNVDTNPKIINMGVELQSKIGSIKVVECEMSTYQYEIYKKALLLDIQNSENSIENLYDIDDAECNPEDDIEIKKKKGLYKNSNDASTMVYPNDTFGKNGYDLLENNLKIILKDNLNLYSTKLASILNNINNSEGTIFIYSNYVNYGGVNIVKQMLLANGFEKYNSSNNSKTYNKFIVFNDSTSPETRDKLRKIFNHPNNKDGSIIKIIIGSPIISEGITLKNVRQVHILEPTWNLSRINQIIGRAVRNNSHADLPINDRYVQIFKYISIYSKDKDLLYIDKEKYLLSEEKDRTNKKVERILKEISFDCFINKDRNRSYYKNYTDYSPECDYQQCEYDCLYKPSHIDFIKENQLLEDKQGLTYNINLHEFDKFAIRKIRTYIQNLFKVYFIWKLDDIVDIIKNEDSTITIESIYTCLNDLKVNKTKLIDKYNRNGFLISRSDLYIFNPLNTDIDSSIYDKIFDFSVESNDITFDNFLKTNYKEIYDGFSLNSKNKAKTSITHVESTLSEQDKKYNDYIIKNYNIYGTYYKDDKYNEYKYKDNIFRLVYKKNTPVIDNRKTNTGKNIISWEIPELKKVIIEGLELQLQGSSKAKLTEQIKNYLEENNRILR